MGCVKDLLTRSINRIKKLISTIDVSFVLLNGFLLAAFVLPVLMLYFFDAGSFDYMWKGRAPYLLFLWLFFLEMFLGWEKLKEKRGVPWTKRILAAAVGLLLPSLYVLSVFVFGLRQEILKLGTGLGVPSSTYEPWFLEFSWPLSLEIIVFTVFFVASIYLVYGPRGLKIFSISSFFLGVIGVFYMLDTFYPYGTLTVLQSFVPLTVSAAAYILNLLGYGTQVFSAGDNGLGLRVIGSGGKNFIATVSWSCAGIHSLFIYSFVILLLLRGTDISLKRKIGYVLVGAFGTFFVNILRIVAILTAGVSGGSDVAVRFHEFYGEFFFIAWMLIYLSVIFVFETYFSRARLFRN
jgi:thaumarchaeosortase